MGVYHSVRRRQRDRRRPHRLECCRRRREGCHDTGDLTVETPERDGYATDVRDARDRVREVGELAFVFPKPSRPEPASLDRRQRRRVRRVMEPKNAAEYARIGRVVSDRIDGRCAVVLGNQRLGPVRPRLADGDDDHGLYFVHPNIRRVADS